jgi:hypothetical protein
MTIEELVEKISTKHGPQIKHQLVWAKQDPWKGNGLIRPKHRMVVDSLTEPGLLLSVMITFDKGTHASGWWKNSQYDACWHLSMVGLEPERRLVTKTEFREVPDAERRAWATVVFGDHVTKAWNEPPASKLDMYRNAPASAYTWHSRVFVDREGHAIIPEGEVYTLLPWDEGDSPEKIFTR